MKLGFSYAALLGCALLLCNAQADTSGKTDLATGLPLYPATSNKFDTGDPMRIPTSQLCKSKQVGDFYNVYDAKVSAAVAWCTAHLAGFHKAHGYAHDRSQDIFYNADGTCVVCVTGSPEKEGVDAAAYAITYMKYTPGLPEKAILGLCTGQIVCP